MIVKRLSLSEWASIGEMIGTAAVIVSLLFVAYSINRNTKELQAVNENFLYQIQEGRRSDEATNLQLAELVVKAKRGDALTPGEQRQYFSHVIRGLNAWELAFIRYRSGLISPSEWPTWDRMYADQAVSDFPREWWDQTRLWYTEDFARHVDAKYNGQ